MERFETILENSSDKEYYRQEILEFTDKQKAKLIDLVLKFDNAGAKNPLPWAISEVSEKIPQLGRFLVLKKMFEIAESVENNIDMATDFDGDIKKQYSDLQGLIGAENLKKFLFSYSKGLIYILIGMLDEGNFDDEESGIGWALVKTDEDGEPTKQVIGGLHDDFYEFDDEIK